MIKLNLNDVSNSQKNVPRNSSTDPYLTRRMYTVHV